MGIVDVALADGVIEADERQALEAPEKYTMVIGTPTELNALAAFLSMVQDGA
jgi:hypothetical protein